MQLSINHYTLNLSNDLTTIFKLNTENKVKARTPSKSESWESSENNICLVATTSEDNININNNGIIKNDRSSKIGALISSNDKLILTEPYLPYLSNGNFGITSEVLEYK